MNVTLEQIVSLAKRRGFVFPGSEIYGGLAGTFDYGPLGVTLKKNIENLWWRMFVEERDNMYGIDAAILMNPKAWQASGHVGGFSDPMVTCKACHSRFRVDQLVDTEDFLRFVDETRKHTESFIQDADEKIKDARGLIEYITKSYNKHILDEINKLYDQAGTNQAIVRIVQKDLDSALKFEGKITEQYLLKIPCPSCTKREWGQPQAFNMMFKTYAGVTEDELSKLYLRPETAGGMFVNFKNVVDSFHPKLPFGLAQIGKAFRNEIAPREFVFRVRELEQMEVEYFVRPEAWQEAFEEWRVGMLTFAKAIGLTSSMVHELEVSAEDRAHYSERTIDFEFDYPFGRRELWGLAYRTDFDLRAHQEGSSVSLEYQDEETKTKVLPHVIEPSLGVGRTMLAILVSAYREDELGGEKRVYLALEPKIAPVKAMVSPLLKNKPELVEKAREVRKELQKIHPAIEWDDNGNIGKRYRRQDEIGTPFCITIDFDTLGETPELTDTVTLRHRDTGEQERLSIKEAAEKIQAALA